VTSLLLIITLSAPSYSVERKVSPWQVRQKAHQIVQMLKKQDPRVLRSVMYYMKWVPKLEFKREDCKKSNPKTDLEKINQWELDMLLDMSGIKRKRK
jgi:hypothetical protein